MVYGGFKKRRALILNYASSVTVIFGGVIGYFLSELVEGAALFLLPFAAGNFIYIASTDLIPEIQYKESLKRTSIRFFVFLTGMGLMLAIKLV